MIKPEVMKTFLETSLKYLLTTTDPSLQNKTMNSGRLTLQELLD
jgi:hypothetical protein